MDGMKGLDRWITDGPRQGPRDYDVECEDCGHREVVQGQPELGQVTLDREDCAECGGPLEIV